MPMPDNIYLGLLYDLKPVNLYEALYAAANALNGPAHLATNVEIANALKAAADSLVKDAG